MIIIIIVILIIIINIIYNKLSIIIRIIKYNNNAFCLLRTILYCLFTEVSVEGSEDIWFINFYSPFCSHCHDLAPTVREADHE